MQSVSAQSSSQQVDEKELLKWGAWIGVVAYTEPIKKDKDKKEKERDEVKREGEKVKGVSTQLMNLIASLDSVSGREALLATAAFALRQAQRGKLGRDTAELIKQALVDLYEKGADKEHAKKMLEFAKWIFEAKIFYDYANIERLKQVELQDLLKQHQLSKQSEQLVQQKGG